MTDRRKSIFNWNLISDNLVEDQIKELKSYYKTYHNKQWCYKECFKRLRKYKLAGDISSVVFETSGVTSAIATSGISLVAIPGLSVLIQTYMKHKNVERKMNQCKYAHTTYGHLLNEIKDILRSGHFDEQNLYNKMQFVDDFILDNSPIVDKYQKKNDFIYY